MRASFFNLLRVPAAALLSAAVLLAGCATPPKDPDELAIYKENNDPLEPMNRYIFEVNNGLDELLIKPIASWYNLMLPDRVEQGVHNVLTNLNSPVIFANDAMQGNGPRAKITAERFAINSTLGVAGIFDVAANWWGIKHHDEDFGQTMAVWGVGEGPYLVLPVIGPSNPRDAVGYGVDSVMDPWGWVLPSHLQWINYTRTGIQGIDLRSRNLETLDQIKKGSLDFYATMRSLYRQHRNDEIKNYDEKSNSVFTPSASVDDPSVKKPQLSQTN